MACDPSPSEAIIEVRGFISPHEIKAQHSPFLAHGSDTSRFQVQTRSTVSNGWAWQRLLHPSHWWMTSG